MSVDASPPTLALAPGGSSESREVDELRARIRQLEALVRQKDELLAVAAHDVRSPAAAAMGALELLEPLLGELTDDQRHLLGVARRANEAIVHLGGNFVSAALLDAEDDGAPSPILDLASIADEACAALAVLGRRKGLQLHLEVGEGPATVRADLLWLRSVVWNLVHNALKYTSASVRVQVARTDADVWLCVEDDGVGIPPEHLGRVFDRLTRLRPRGTAGERGTGLGLYVTHQLVARLGGTLEVARREPNGARFVARLPFVEGAAAPIAERWPL